MPSIINATTTTGVAITGDNSGNLAIQTNNGNTAVTINTSLGVQVANCLGVGNATASTSGAGITFPATASASSDANTLDDYEEGTWSPTIRFAGASAGLTYVYQRGFYTKVGNIVTCTFDVKLSNRGSSGGAASLGGLPFNSRVVSGNYGSMLPAYWEGMSSLPDNCYTNTIDEGQTSVELRYQGTAGSSNLNETNFTNNSRLLGTIILWT
jgi:hypothetical protein